MWLLRLFPRLLLHLVKMLSNDSINLMSAWIVKSRNLTYKSLVYILVNTMSNYIATIIKTGNSYALRVPKSYVENAKLVLGQKVQIGAPVTLPKDYDPEAVKTAIRNLQTIGAFRTIKDPVAWQREIRKDRSMPGRN